MNAEEFSYDKQFQKGIKTFEYLLECWWSFFKRLHDVNVTIKKWIEIKKLKKKIYEEKNCVHIKISYQLKIDLS